ncbi:DEAD/DEAH box helicase [Actinacidiphila bryophytorum]|uniref:Superfamily II DNA or RNA helicase, SNF2 family n=1 Tax=Actinacidiphila bryophytorum TaxID=1436133 RepID=A0A9W4H1U7_9ACTN|nr:DEAD/DEAH box helicase [Actinacidiphila bryophytorum]MBM9435229.1 DEAD/DEAH box helicase [Actinacidiphila bryophytorum]MBN6545813.1 DEAD/DEAH box helicase [Actinacidiphila bryophytorum]CAG7643837.1 Superfamily II DNA or RNA helicase, SNF2 family [Actinacidiphila bryophytorum]
MERGRLVGAVRQLAAGEAGFEPAEPPREGTVVFWTPGGDPPDVGVPYEELTVGGPGAGAETVRAVRIPVGDAVQVLTRCRALGAEGRASASTAFWGAAATLALGLLARGRAGRLDAADEERLTALAATMPAQASPEPLLRAFLDAVADALTKGRSTFPAPPAARRTRPAEATAPPAARRMLGTEAVAPNASTHRPAARRTASDDASKPRLAVSLRVDPDRLRAVVQVAGLGEPGVVADAADVWAGRRPGADVVRVLRRAARVWPPAARLLDVERPDELELSAEEAAQLLGPAAARLSAAGVAVYWPKDLVRGLTARGGVLQPQPTAGAGFLDSGALLDFQWRVALGDDDLTPAELEELVAAHRPVVRLRDRWVVVDAELVRRLRRRRPPLTPVDALAAALTGTVEVDGEPVPVTAGGALEELRARVAEPAAGGTAPQGAPKALAGTLRDYQLRGLGWLHRMTSLGLGGCLADDMGLGKTVTLIALHLRRQEEQVTAGPTLVVCPASLLGNWEREVRRFAPAAAVRRFHGPNRDLASAVEGGGFVLTTYGTMRRDAERLAAHPWGLLVADEAQHVKNPHSRTAQALRTIPSRGRVALTGTPVENNLTELWALLDWTTPGLLGTLPSFRARYARAVEDGRDPRAAAHLAALVRPFMLRRRKSDPGIAPELPRKTETDRPVPLTREQVSLYEALVRELLAEIGGSSGMARRGLVMRLLTGLKQVCNHPAQFLKEPPGARLPGRSGKLALLDDLLDTVVAEGESALVFTQYVAMGRLIERHLGARGLRTAFLHGGTPVARREQLVDDFQAGGPRVFLLSLKAAGTGLNLTRAGHVIHYDRWWNPAVEDQATDRAYRIGQTRPVQVHRIVAEGTVEDRVAGMLRRKRELADAVLGSGEAALCDLSDGELAELVALRRPRL